jgi:hypothetical protein
LTGIIKLFPPRESLVSDIPAGDRKTANLFLQCGGAGGGDALFHFEAKITKVKRSEKFEAKISEKKRKKRSEIL